MLVKLKLILVNFNLKKEKEKIMKPEKVIADKIKEKGYIQKFVADKIGISECSLSLSLKGKRSLKANELIALCIVLDIHLSDFSECYCG